jgi:hypothetical protein
MLLHCRRQVGQIIEDLRLGMDSAVRLDPLKAFIRRAATAFLSLFARPRPNSYPLDGTMARHQQLKYPWRRSIPEANIRVTASVCVKKCFIVVFSLIPAGIKSDLAIRFGALL